MAIFCTIYYVLSYVETIPQIIKLLRTKSSNDYSLGMVTLQLIALISWSIYIFTSKQNIVVYIGTIIDLIILFIIYLVSGILTYQNIYSILPILAAMIYLYFVWNGNELKVKKAAFYCYFLWLTYNICVFSIAGIISNIVSIISTFIAIHNEKKCK